MRSTLRRTWAEVSLDAIEHNYKALRARIGENVKFLGVVKADAYGHGAVHVARTLQELGAVDCPIEALARHCCRKGAVGHFKPLEKADVEALLRAAQ